MGNQNSAIASGLESANTEFAVDIRDRKKSGYRSADNLSHSLSLLENPPLRFHCKHGDYVAVSPDGRIAKRTQSYCRGIVFTDRPIRRNEKVCFRVKEQMDSRHKWTGALRIGITRHNPEDVDLSNALYLCPDLTNLPGFWARPCPELPDTKEKIIHFRCLDNGTIVYGVNGVEKGVAFEDVDLSRPLYGVWDIYGSTTAIELLDPAILGNSRLAKQTSYSLGQKSSAPAVPPDLGLNKMTISGSPVGVLNPPDSRRSGTSTDRLVQSARGQPNPSSPAQSKSLTRSPAPSPSSLLNTSFTPRYRARHFPHLSLAEMRFNKDLYGRNVRLSDEGRCARLSAGEFCNGYVFTSRPIPVNETVLIRIIENDWDFDGGIAFGLTTCDPNSLCQAHLPDDADLLLDRLEYWIVAKDVATKPKEGEEFSFTIRSSGTVQISRNNNKPADFLFVDATQSFWMFFELYGTTRKIALLGSCISNPATPAPPNNTHSKTPSRAPAVRADSLPVSPVVELPPATRQISSTITPQQNSVNTRSALASSLNTSTTVQPRRTSAPTTGDLIDFGADTQASRAVDVRPTPSRSTPPNAGPSTARSNSALDKEFPEGECCICFEKPVDCVLYACGHQVMCYECGAQQFNQKKLCPICRVEIKDVIKTYRA